MEEAKEGAKIRTIKKTIAFLLKGFSLTSGIFLNQSSTVLSIKSVSNDIADLSLVIRMQKTYKTKWSLLNILNIK